VDTIHAGFTGTGFVDFADNVAGGFTEFSVNRTGVRTLTFRYGNGSMVNRVCNITLNGVSVGTLSFPPTGAWPTWKTISLQVNFGTAAGNKALRVTSTTTAGGPNLDKLDIQ
jgi:endoglucanase